jgi:hypothetical protein
MLVRAIPQIATTFALVACGTTSPQPAQTRQASTSATVAAIVIAPPVATVEAPTSSTSATTATAAPPPAVSASAVLPASSAAPVPAAASIPATVPVDVKIVTFGMHVGGGPFDEPTKVPFKQAVEPKFGVLALCYSSFARKPIVDFGVDLMIDAQGGAPVVTRPRSSARNESGYAEFETCAVKFFESIAFGKPKMGRVGVSYSVQISPKK